MLVYCVADCLSQMVMTPVHFTTFVVSLIIIDWWYTLLRSYTHSQSPMARRLPAWLHGLIYQEQPYAYGRDGRDGDRAWYYHSKQKSLMRMEAEEAFRFRKTVLVGMAVGAVLTVASIWTLSRHAIRYGMSWLH
jgi:hypothetical protein